MGNAVNCNTCIYLGSQTIVGIPSLQGLTLLEHNVCRRNAPGARGWPVIPFPNTDWCGQHKPKAPAECGTCGNCRYFDDYECRERPPVPNCGFPAVGESDWCSRWEAKP